MLKKNISPLFYYVTRAFIACLLLTFSLKLYFYYHLHDSVNSLSTTQIFDAFKDGLVFDCAVAAFFSLLYLLISWIDIRVLKQKLNHAFVLWLHLFALFFIQTGDSLYVFDAGRHVSYESKDFATDFTGLIHMAFAQNLSYIMLSFLIMIGVYLVVIKISKQIFNIKPNYSPAITLEFQLIGVFLLLAIVIRGGFGVVPLEPLSAFKSGNTDQGLITLNGAYSTVYGFANSSKQVKRVAIHFDEPIDELSKRNLLTRPKSNLSNDIKPYNVVFVFLESWRADAMASYGDIDKTTPYFDSLIPKSIAPKIVIAGGYRTTEGLFSTLCSFQNPLGKTVAQSQLQNFDYLCLPHLLAEKGWQTTFFQGSNKNTSGTGIFAQRLGFKDSYGKQDVDQRQYQENSWGVHDPDLYQFVLDKAQTLQEPFLIGINTTTTHDDQVPDSFKAPFDSSSVLGRYKNTLNFADSALQQFIQNYNKMKFEKPTIFVLVADHTAGRAKNNVTKSLIPGIIYSPSENIQKVINHPVHQRDFSPTILDLLHIQKPNSFAGQSLVKPQNSLWDGEFYNPAVLSVIKNKQLLRINLSNNSIKCYQFGHSMLSYSSTQCPKNSQAISDSALAFTQYSQELLFEGKTTSFMNLNKAE